MATARPHDSAALTKAISRFKNKLTGPQYQQICHTTFKDLQDEVGRIQKEQEDRKTLMNLSRIQSFLEAMQPFSKVLEVFLNTADLLAFVWGPIKFLLLVASNWADSFEILLDAYENIGEQLPLLADYETLLSHSPSMIEVIEMMYVDILEFHGKALKFFYIPGKGKSAVSVWKQIIKSAWKDFDAQFKGICEKLRRHKELIEGRAQLEHYRRYRDDMQYLKARTEQLVAENHDKKIRAVRQWLATSSQAQDDHDTFLSVRNNHPTTGRWILGHDIIADWMNADVPVTSAVWMTGIPRAGKTILASVIAQECKTKQNFLTSHFYCRYDGKHTAVEVAVGLLEQILDQSLSADPSSVLLAHCYARFTRSGEPVLRSLTIAKALLKELCSVVPKQYIIVDGIDECTQGQRKELLELLVGIVQECDAAEPGKLRVLFVSQEFGDIKRALYSSAAKMIAPREFSPPPADSRRDIYTYASHLTNQIKVKFDLSDEQASVLLEKTVSYAKGMFLYAKLVLENLLSQTTTEQLLQEITEATFPKKLKQAYERILARVQTAAEIESEWDLAKRLLGWIVCAKRPLSWREMQVALSLDFDNETVLYDHRKLRKHVKDICGSLVLLTGKSNDRVQLVHSTAREYIPICTHDIRTSTIECELAAKCLRYLAFHCFQDDAEAERRLRDYVLQGHLGFQDYAVAKWFHHVNAFINMGEKVLQANAPADRPLLDEVTTAFREFVRAYDDDGTWDQAIGRQCIDDCKAFKGHDLYEDLIFVSSHIYAFQTKGFNLRHTISIKTLAAAVERNRKFLENFFPKLDAKEKRIYEQFYDSARRFKCSRITCNYFSEGFKDPKSRDRHVNLHDRPYHCEVPDCLGGELGFTNSQDLEKHNRTYHSETIDTTHIFRPIAPVRQGSHWPCSICGKTFTRNLHRKDHENSHRGERPYTCPECGKAFTRVNDMKRHSKLHDRNVIRGQ